MNTPTPPAVSVPAVPILSSTVSSPIRPSTKFIKAAEIQKLFKITKREYDDILVRIRKIILNNFVILPI